uniref:PPM-type phosphatase domain-containing protein n=1 Tax=Globisporangium ultimum (strain ATCC 200006 / CBS 805.95 / DAOM BR144) TaxID=431595 RepID=K3X688_GLOUD
MSDSPKKGFFRQLTKRFHRKKERDRRSSNYAVFDAFAASNTNGQPRQQSPRRYSLTGVIDAPLVTATSHVQTESKPQPQPTATYAAASTPAIAPVDATSPTSAASSSLQQEPTKPFRRYASAPISAESPDPSMASLKKDGSVGSSISRATSSSSDKKLEMMEEEFDEAFDEVSIDDLGVGIDDEENEENQESNGVRQLNQSESSPTSKKKKNPISVQIGLATAEGLMGHDNEDRLVVEHNEHFRLFAVLDGHGGSMAAEFVKEKLFSAIERCYDHGFKSQELSDTIDALDDEFQGEAQRIQDMSGACLTCVLLYVDETTGTPQTLTLNVGDCRAIMHEARGKGKKDNKGFGPNGKLYALSEDHCEENKKEKERVLKSGAFIEYGRIGGVLEPFRSIGDIDMKEKEMEGWVIATPEIKKSRLLVGRSTLILATDGVWGSLENQKVMTIARKFSNDPQAAADAILEASRDAGSLDDIGIIVVKV